MARRSMGGRRMHVILTTTQDKALQLVAKKTELPIAHHIRRAIDQYLTSLVKKK